MTVSLQYERDYYYISRESLGLFTSCYIFYGLVSSSISTARNLLDTDVFKEFYIVFMSSLCNSLEIFSIFIFLVDAMDNAGLSAINL